MNSFEKAHIFFALENQYQLSKNVSQNQVLENFVPYEWSPIYA